MSPSISGGEVDLTHHRIGAHLDPTHAWIAASDTLELVCRTEEPWPETVHLLLNRALDVEGVERQDKGRWVPLLRKTDWMTYPTVDPQFFIPEPDSEDWVTIDRCQELQIYHQHPEGEEKKLELVITYAGTIYDSLRTPDSPYARSFATSSGLIDTAGAYLGSETVWLPTRPFDLFSFTLEVDLPHLWRSMSQGILRRNEIVGNRRIERWDTSGRPMQEAYLIAGPYVVEGRMGDDSVELLTYLYHEEPELSDRYLKATQRYLKRFGEVYGAYPYQKFALVENFWQTGYGMPSFTFLGDRVIRLPFIIDTSYGHEILHNWWGNGVFIDPRQGNWCEGLTTYGADYSFACDKGPADARAYRQGILRDYLNYVREENDFPLSEFTSRSSAVTQNVGYGKTMMVFHMLRRRLGDDAFFAALRDFYQERLFQIAGWEELLSSFEKISGEDLDWFLAQWVQSPGAPRIGLGEVRLQPKGEHYRVEAVITQEPPAYRLQLPVKISGQDRDTTVTVDLNSENQTCRIDLSWAPVSFAVDPDFQCFRRVHRQEIPVTLSQTLGADSIVVILPRKGPAELREAFTELAREWEKQSEHLRVVTDGEVSPAELSGCGIWLLGECSLGREFLEALPSSIRISRQKWFLNGEEYSPEGRTVIVSAARPGNPDVSWTWLLTEDPASVAPVGRKIPHYGKYTYLVFEGARNIGKGIISPETSPLTVFF